MVTPFIDFHPPLIAHRGANRLAPENTLSAFSKAKAMGANWVEFDVMLCKTGEAVVIHDDTLERTTNGEGLVIDKTWTQLQDLDAGTWFDPVFSTEKIPLFEDVIRFLNTHAMDANVEIKPYLGYEIETAKKVLAILQASWSKDAAPPLISSFSMDALLAVRSLDRSAKLAMLIHEWFPEWREMAKTLECYSINVNHEILDKALVKEIKQMGYRVLTYTVNDPLEAKKLLSWGVDAIFTDVFDSLLKQL